MEYCYQSSQIIGIGVGLILSLGLGIWLGYKLSLNKLEKTNGN